MREPWRVDLIQVLAPLQPAPVFRSNSAACIPVQLACARCFGVQSDERRPSSPRYIHTGHCLTENTCFSLPPPRQPEGPFQARFSARQTDGLARYRMAARNGRTQCEEFVQTGSTRGDPAASELQSTATLSPYRTDLPGVFALGDVRSGSVKRVASAMGKGSVVVQAVHQYLAARCER